MLLKAQASDLTPQMSVLVGLKWSLRTSTRNTFLSCSGIAGSGDDLGNHCHIHTCHHYSLYVLCSPLCQNADVKVFEAEDFILAHGFRRVSPSQKGWQGRTEQSTSWQSGSRERCMQSRVTARCRPGP